MHTYKHLSALSSVLEDEMVLWELHKHRFFICINVNNHRNYILKTFQMYLQYFEYLLFLFKIIDQKADIFFLKKGDE